MSDAPDARRSRLPLLGLALFLGILVAASLYAFGGSGKFFADRFFAGKFFAGMDEASACAASAASAARLKPFVRGEVAGVQVLEQPTPARELQFLDGAGAGLSLAHFRGRLVLLNLWATWCLPCRLEMPRLDKLNADLGADARFQVVAINIDTRNPDKPREFLRQNNIHSLAYFADPSARVFQELKSAGRAFGMPTTVLIDARGCELAHLAGPAEWAGADARALIQAALGQ